MHTLALEEPNEMLVLALSVLTEKERLSRLDRYLAEFDRLMPRHLDPGTLVFWTASEQATRPSTAFIWEVLGYQQGYDTRSAHPRYRLRLYATRGPVGSAQTKQILEWARDILGWYWLRVVAEDSLEGYERVKEGDERICIPKYEIGP